MEFPERDTGSWKKFKYSFYLRGGGPGNEGMDLNYFFFDNENYRYVIYDTYTSAGSKNSIGVKVINVDTGVTTDIPGKVNTRQGSLTDFRDNSLVEISEELFD